MTRNKWQGRRGAATLAAALLLGSCAGMPGYGSLSIDSPGFGEAFADSGYPPAYTAFSPDYAPDYAPDYGPGFAFGIGGLIGGFRPGEWHGGGWHGGGWHGGDWHGGGGFHGPAPRWH